MWAMLGGEAARVTIKLGDRIRVNITTQREANGIKEGQPQISTIEVHLGLDLRISRDRVTQVP